VEETLVDAIDRLRALGYVVEYSAVPGGRLRCGACSTEIAAADARIDDVVRFEGMSDPDDEAILYALTAECGDRGTYVAAYGPMATRDDVDVAAALTR
jgi:hypothetical protein